MLVLTEQASDAGDARILLGRLQHRAAVLLHAHAAQLVDHEGLAVEAVAALPEDHRPLRLQLDRDRGEDQRRRQERQRRRRDDDVEQPLGQAIERRQRRRLDLHHVETLLHRGLVAQHGRHRAIGQQAHR
jgi:hypothetical protein